MNGKHRKIAYPDIHHTINELKQEKIFLKEINEYLNKKEGRAEEILETLAHELRTPLVPINAYTDMLLVGHLGKLNKKQLERLKVVSSSTKSMYRLISNLLDAAKFEAGEVTLDKRQHGLNEIIEKAISSIKNSTSELDNIIHYLPKKDVSVFCDLEKISQVLVNLIENSLDAVSKDKGHIEINVDDKGNIAKIMVKDNGKGISPDKLSHLFSKFYQVDMSHTREKGGAGLGLYLCRKIIESHDGKIWATSTIGKGTTVTFTIQKA